MPNETSNTQNYDINEVTDFSQEFSEVEVVKDNSNVEVSDSEIKEINDELKEAINEDKNVFFGPDAAEEEQLPPVENNSDSVVINKPVSANDNESKFPYAIPDATLNTCPTKGY